jgi:hypothetical protein
VGGQSSFSQVAAAMAASPSRACVPFFFLSFLYYFCSPKTIQHAACLHHPVALPPPEQVPISALACYSATEQPGDGVRAAGCKCERCAEMVDFRWWGWVPQAVGCSGCRCVEGADASVGMRECVQVWSASCVVAVCERWQQHASVSAACKCECGC